jgi:membrane protease YdiL (CAAX protease family)
MAYPAISDLASFIFVFAVGIPLIFLLGKVLKLQPKKPDIKDSKKQAQLSILVFVLTFIAAFCIYGFYDKIWVRTTLTADPLYIARDLIAMFIILLPTTITLKLTKQRLSSIALTKKNLKESLILGSSVSLGLIIFIAIFAKSLGGGLASFSNSSIYLLLSYMIVVLGEELVFRGYMQTRINANYGPFVAVAASGILYGTYNFALGFYCFGWAIPLATVYALLRISTGLIYSYTFHQTQNLASSYIVHVLLVWGGLMFGLYL